MVCQLGITGKVRHGKSVALWIGVETSGRQPAAAGPASLPGECRIGQELAGYCHDSDLWVTMYDGFGSAPKACRGNEELR